jgi:cell shape-determining protein MreC
MDPERDAIDHDKRLNEEELKIIKDIKRNVNKLKDSINELETLLEELEEFNEEELKRPLLKEDEYRTFIRILDIQKILHNNIVLITQDLLRYKILLDQEVF